MRSLVAGSLPILALSLGCAAAPAASSPAPATPARGNAEATVAIPPVAPPATPPAAEASAAADENPEELDAKGSMWGDQIGDSFGQGGLGLSGIGEGGGGTGEGTIGLGKLGTIGQAGGSGTGQGFGSGAGRLGGSRQARGTVKAATATTTGSGLPPEVIRRIVRAHMVAIQYCYEKALAKSPTLAGKVALSFTIDAKGAVSSVSAGDTNIGDAEMMTCLTKAVRNMSFPAPENGGTVMVTYPFNFSPPDQ